MSNGGGMAYRLACDAADRIAAISLVSADYLGSDRCTRSRPVPAIAFHGTADTRVPMEGVTYGTSVHPPVVSWASGWAVRNGCNARPVQTAVTGGQVLPWQGCGERADVLLYQVTGGTLAGSSLRSTPTISAGSSSPRDLEITNFSIQLDNL